MPIKKLEIQYNKNTEIKAELKIKVGHIEAIDTAKVATCTENGLTEGKHCEVCSTTLVEQQEIPALGHEYEEIVTEPKYLEKG